MTQQLLLRRRLTAGLLDALSSEGFALGAGKLMQVEELLRQLPPDTAPEELRTLLTPLLATNAAEQHSFYELFDRQLQALQEEESPREPTDDKKDDPSEKLQQSENRWSIALLALQLLLCFAAGFIFDRGGPFSWLPLLLFLPVAAAAILNLYADTARRALYLLAALLLCGAGALFKQKLFRPEPIAVPIPSPGRTERFAVEQGRTVVRSLQPPGDSSRPRSALSQGRSEGLSPLGSRFQLDTAGTLTYTAGAEAAPGTTDTLRVVAAYSAQRSDTIVFLADILEARPDTPIVATDTLPWPFPRELSELEVDAAAQSRADFYHRYRWPLKILLFLLTGFAWWAFLYWRERRRAKFVAKITQNDRPPYVWQFNTNDKQKPDFGEGLALLLNRLRRREEDEASRLNVPATVRASARQAGRVSFVYRQLSRPPEYLLLIDRYKAEADHQAQLFDSLYRELLDAGVLVTRYFYQGDPLICFDEKKPEGIRLAELLHQHRQSRLLLVGDGQRLLMPSDGLPAPWTDIFSGWRHRALLSLKPASEWGRRERVLSGLFTIVPATLQGLDLALEQFETATIHSPAEALRRVRDSIPEPVEFEWGVMESLQRYFDKPLLRWIAACAVYPTLHWDLTLHLGRKLSEGSDEQLLSAANLRQLTRLPWFLQGRMPESARLRLLEYLADEKLESGVRRILDELLQSASPVEGSVAWNDHRMYVLLNKMLLQPKAAERRQLEREFGQYLDAGERPDVVTFERLKLPPTPLDLIVPDKWKKYLFRHESSRFGLQERKWLFPGLLLLALGTALIPVKNRVCDGEAVEWQGKTLCLDSPDDRLLYLEHLTHGAIAGQYHARADSLRAVAGAIARAASPAADTVPFYRNTAVMYYNFAARDLRCAESPGAAACPPLSADSLLSRACDNLTRGAARYRVLTGSEGIEFAGAMQRACDTVAASTLFSLSGQVLAEDNGQPLAGARVEVRTDEGNYSDTTDADGRYRLQEVQLTERLRLRVSAAGYETATLETPASAELPAVRLKVPAAARDEAAWRRAKAAGFAQEALNEYLSAFPDGAHAAEARRRLDDSASAREKADWEQARRTNTIPAFEAYKRKYPAGVYVAEADRLLAGLQEKADYDETLRQNTIAGWELFLNQYPDGAYNADARRRLENLRDETAWEQAVAANTPAAFQNYLDRHPQGRYAEEASKRTGVPLPFKEPDMVFVKGGTFTMGCTKEQGKDCSGDEEPAHQVTVADFYIGRYEVTQKEWRELTGESPSSFKNCDDCPVESVSWDDAQDFLSALNKKTGKNYRLPTEAEWEYAARGGAASRGYKYAGSDDIGEVAWWHGRLFGNSDGKTHPVGRKKPNELGLYDMSGNVWEWCQDWYGDYPAGAQRNPKGPETGSSHVLRGGSAHESPNASRVAARIGEAPFINMMIFGLRLARTN
jgi:formylglycine-generating enzyme required for sulfatase activity